MTFLSGLSISLLLVFFWGGDPLPKSAQKCIASWRKYLPDYEIKEWNESYFDVNIIPYTAEAYKAKKSDMGNMITGSMIYMSGGRGVCVIR